MSKSVEFNGTAFNKVVILKEIIEATIDAETNLDVSNDADKNDKTRKGLVVAVGETVPSPKSGLANWLIGFFIKRKQNVNPGDYVLYNRHAASNLTHEGVKYKLIYYDDLILKL
jgi:co-chaperonin GroES (HSP10)